MRRYFIGRRQINISNEHKTFSPIETTGEPAVKNTKYNEACAKRKIGANTGQWKEFNLLLHHDVITSISNTSDNKHMRHYNWTFLKSV